MGSLSFLQGGASTGQTRGLAGWQNVSRIPTLLTSFPDLSLFTCKMGIYVCASWVWSVRVSAEMEGRAREEAGGKAGGVALRDSQEAESQDLVGE